MNRQLRWSISMMGYRFYANITLAAYKKPDFLQDFIRRCKALSQDEQDILIAQIKGISVRRLIYERSGP